MREVTIARHGSPDVLEVVDRTPGEPGPGEVRIRVKAAGVNFADVMMRQGHYPDAPSLPFVPGFEVSGYIEAIGPGPTRHEVGRHVIALTRLGGYADTVVVPGDFAFNAPPRLSHNEAAAVPVSYLTGIVALYRMAGLKAGETVLIHNAGGGVGVAAVQLARLRRATVLGTASAAKHNALRSLGIDHVLDDAPEQVEKAVMDFTHGRGVDVVLDSVGGENLARSHRLLAPLGRLIAYGVHDTSRGEHRGVIRTLAAIWNATTHAPAALAAQNRGVFSLDMNQLWTERRFLHASMEALLTDVAAGRLKPVVAKAFPLGRACDAHRFLEDRANVGKVVLTC
jgi:NADPH:quinone reductase-like Zn-dependent oxidoreductase